MARNLTCAFAGPWNRTHRKNRDGCATRGSDGEYGNMSCAPGGGGSVCPQMDYNAASNQLTDIGGQPPQGVAVNYDAAGNQLNDVTDNYQYDAEGRMTYALNTLAGNWHTMIYNALGQRVTDTMPDGAQDRTLIYPRDIFGHRTGAFDHRPSIGWTGWNIFWARVAGQRLLMGGSTSLLRHADTVGTTTMLTDQTGAVVGQVKYYTWGELWGQSGDVDGNAFGDLGFQVNNPVPLATYRDYNPDLGRWLTPDPMGGDVTNPQSLNRYAYVTNNPATLNDPLGLTGGHYPRYEEPCLDGIDCYGGDGFFGSGGGGDVICPPDDLFCDFANPDNWDPLGGGLLVYGWPHGGGGTAATAPPAGQPPLAGGNGAAFVGDAAVWEQIEQQYPWIVSTVWACAYAPVCQEVLAGAAVGVAVGYGVVALQNYIHQAKGGRQNIPPTWVTDRPRPGESAEDFARRVCTARYGSVAGCGSGPGSEFNKIKKWAQDWINKHG